MTTEEALLAAVLTSPGDDLPRLVYADWCDENGQPERAEFIRVQCDLAHVPLRGDCDDGVGIFCSLCRNCTLRKRARALLRDNWEQWFGGLHIEDTPLDRYYRPGVSGIVRRGFVEVLRCDLSNWVGGVVEFPDGNGTYHRLGLGPALVAMHPVMRVELTDRDPHWNGRAYCWFHADRPQPSGVVPDAAVLPADLFDVAKHHPLHVTGVSGRLVGWVDPATAHSALSDACLAWAKHQNALAENPKLGFSPATLRA